MSVHRESTEEQPRFLESPPSAPIIHILCSIKHAQVYQLPPKQEPGSFKAEEWSKMIWTGVLQVRGSLDGSESEILCLDAEGKPCARSSGRQLEMLEKVVDSSRYFVFPIESEELQLDCPEGRVGIGFTSRNDAFAFSSALQDLHKGDTDEEILQVTSSIGDLRLREGETMRIDMKHAKDRSRSRSRPSLERKDAEGSVQKSATLAPPPLSGKTRQRQRQRRVKTSSS